MSSNITPQLAQFAVRQARFVAEVLLTSSAGLQPSEYGRR
jgi:NADH dehydrogenase FAD-containing subunit